MPCAGKLRRHGGGSMKLWERCSSGGTGKQTGAGVRYGYFSVLENNRHFVLQEKKLVHKQALVYYYENSTQVPTFKHISSVLFIK